MMEIHTPPPVTLQDKSPHQCSNCNDLIRPGETYDYAVVSYRGRRIPIYNCMKCAGKEPRP